MSARVIGYNAALVGFALDQATKLWALFIYQIEQAMQVSGPIALTSFFDFVLVWNRGISYGLFQQDSDIGRYLLIGLAVTASLLLAGWIWRTGDRLLSFGLGLILGGAAGNGLDRILHGAVVDLFHFHWGTFSWYVFNLADVWIVIGAALLVYDSLFGNREDKAQSSRKDAANQ